MPGCPCDVGRRRQTAKRLFRLSHPRPNDAAVRHLIPLLCNMTKDKNDKTRTRIINACTYRCFRGIPGEVLDHIGDRKLGGPGADSPQRHWCRKPLAPALACGYERQRLGWMSWPTRSQRSTSGRLSDSSLEYGPERDSWIRFNFVGYSYSWLISGAPIWRGYPLSWLGRFVCLGGFHREDSVLSLDARLAHVGVVRGR